MSRLLLRGLDRHESEVDPALPSPVLHADAGDEYHQRRDEREAEQIRRYDAPFPIVYRESDDEKDEAQPDPEREMVEDDARDMRRAACEKADGRRREHQRAAEYECREQDDENGIRPPR